MGHKYSREEILDGALRTALTDGLSQLTFGRLARRLGVSDRVIVYYFPSKTELIVSVLTVALASLGAARIDVLWWGKVSTFALMTSFPLFLLTTNPHHVALRPWQHDVRDICWVIGVMGLTLSWIVLIGYVKPALHALRTGRQARRIL